MCKSINGIRVVLLHPAIMFLNSNKAESNIIGVIHDSRKKCSMAGITLMQEYVISKGADRDIDRDAINILINFLITGRYDTVVVNKLTDLTEDEADLREFICDAANIGVGFFELSTMQYLSYE